MWNKAFFFFLSICSILKEDSMFLWVKSRSKWKEIQSEIMATVAHSWQASKKRLMFLQFRIFSPPSSRLSFFSTLSLLPLPPSFHSPARYRAFLSLFHSFLRSLHTYHGFLPFSLSLPTPRHLHHYSRQPYPSFLSSSPFLSPIITTLTFVISLRLPLRFLPFFFSFSFLFFDHRTTPLPTLRGFNERQPFVDPRAPTVQSNKRFPDRWKNICSRAILPFSCKKISAILNTTQFENVKLF